MNHPRVLRTAALVMAVIGGASLLSACAPLIFGGAMAGTALMALDRRTSGTQVEDQTIELKAIARVREAVGERGHVNVTSYNKLVLISGEAPNEADKAAVEQAVARVENVRSIVNELAVRAPSALTSRSNDSFVTSKVKASFVDAKDLQANAFKVVTERGIVYLMGRVTEREAGRAADVARGVNGVQKVVRLFEVITEAELADLQPKQVQK